MKRILIPTALLLATMAFPAGAIAKGKSGEVDISKTSQINGTTLEPGTYKVTTNNNGSTSEVTFSKNGKQVATVSGQVVQLQRKANYTSVTIDNKGSVPRIAEIDFEGQQTAVSFPGQDSAASAGD